MSTIKSIYFPERTFASKEDLFRSLKANEQIIIDCKKSMDYTGEKKGICLGNMDRGGMTTDIEKGLGFQAKDNFIYPIISTTRYMDSHKDVHLDGCFTKTCKEQQGKVYYCADHNLTTTGIIAMKSDVSMFVRGIDWSFVGKNYTGQTEALIFGIDKSKIVNDLALKIINTEKDLQNSIRMRYVTIKMAIDSKEKDYIDNKEYFDKHIDSIVNKDAVLKEGYFFGVEELKIQGEGSLVIAGGSNDATAIYQKINEDAA
jgi:hypothetical protein